ncbi:MAG TPA: hypothetical protein VHI93_00220, partial [Candidatus Thermoplasmatota archaeon]|nr:hypothetical protein [Candidatus Thermoplasmatota archaeon]
RRRKKGQAMKWHLKAEFTFDFKTGTPPAAFQEVSDKLYFPGFPKTSPTWIGNASKAGWPAAGRIGGGQEPVLFAR